MLRLGILIISEIIIVICVITCIYRNRNKPSEATQRATQEDTQRTTQKTEHKEETKRTEYAHHYQPKYLLTKNEWYEYKKLRDLAAAHGLQVCPKVRLLDIIEPRRGDPQYMTYLGKIKSKHVDFVICDQDLRIKGVLELDDNSHDQKDRQERDRFVDEILTGVGYKVIHTRSITENTLEPITGAGKEQAAP